MFSAAAASDRYQPRPQDADGETFRARLEACQSCPLRDDATCRFTNQFVTVMARQRARECPNQAWPLNSEFGVRSSECAGGPVAIPHSELRAPNLTHATIPAGEIPYLGTCARKPWEYEITACVPTLNGSARLPLVIELLRLQTVRPFIVIVDTGSRPEHWRATEGLRAPDVEVHALRLNAVEHPSEPVAMAMDLALAVCRTRFLFATHDDCFLRMPLALRFWRNLARRHRAAGHRLSPRPHDDWATMFGHTALMLDCDWLLDDGLTWNMRRGARLFGMKRPLRVAGCGNWPDTETGLNYLSQLAGVTPAFTGDEENYARNVDDLIDHCRSAGGSALYKPDYAQGINAQWLEAASQEGWERVAEWRMKWSTGELAEEPPLPDDFHQARLKVPTFTDGRY